MTRTARACPQRWLLAALCLLASVAFALRGLPVTGGAPRSPDPVASRQTEARPAHHLHAAAQAAPRPAGCAPGDLPAPGQRHAAHCPLCAAGTFAVDPPGAVAPGGARTHESCPGRPPLHARPAPPRQADPRAPPVSGPWS